MTAPTIPDLPPAYGEPTGDASAAARALTENDEAEQIALVVGTDDDGKASTEPRQSIGADAGRDVKRKRGRPSKNSTGTPPQPAGVSDSPPVVATDPATLSERALRRLPKRALRPALLQLHKRLGELETRNAELARDQAALSVVDHDQVAKSLRMMLSDVVDLLDTGAQLFAGEQLASSVALDTEEKTHLVELSEPVARQQLGAHVVNSPWLALGLGVGAIALAKYLALRDAKKALRESV